MAGPEVGAFISLPAPRLPAHRTPTARLSPLVVSAAIHAVGVASMVAALAGTGPAAPSATVARPDAAVVMMPRAVFLVAPGRGGGGGGGGNRQPAPIRHAERVGRDRATVPIARPLSTTERTADVPEPAQQILLDAKPLASGVTEQIGAIEGGVGFGTSLGPGWGGGAGEGVGTGVGSGRGLGVGPGSGGGTGGGLYRPGGAVTPPTLASQVRPSYTNEALRQLDGGKKTLPPVHEMAELAYDTGGRAITIHDLAALGRVYTDIGSELRQMYRLGYPFAAARDGRWHALSVRVLIADARTRTRAGYYAPRPNTLGGLP